MTEDPAPTDLNNARDAAYQARKLYDQHRRAHRDGGPADGPVARRGEELERLAAAAGTRFELAKQQARGAASMKRRAQSIAEDAQLQSRLRHEAQARREAAASKPPLPRRGQR
jgi:hypothetical protein